MCWCMSICPYVHELLLVGLLVILPVAHCCTSPRTSREFHPPHCLLYRGRWSPMPAWVLWRRRLSGRGPCRSFQLWGSRLCNPLALWWAHAPKHENGDRPIFVWVVSELRLCALERSRYVLRKGCASHAAGIIILFFPPGFDIFGSSSNLSPHIPPPSTLPSTTTHQALEFLSLSRLRRFAPTLELYGPALSAAAIGRAWRLAQRLLTELQQQRLGVAALNDAAMAAELAMGASRGPGTMVPLTLGWVDAGEKKGETLENGGVGRWLALKFGMLRSAMRWCSG